MQEESKDEQEPESVQINTMVEDEPILPTQSDPEGFFNASDDNCSVKVAVRVRPLIGRELRDGANRRTCITTEHNSGKLQINGKEFAFDNVFGPETDQVDLYRLCSKNQILGCFDGYNATILAYGQTGSGKTHTMGTGSTIGLAQEHIGIVPRVFDFIFEELALRQRQNELSQFSVKCQFLELYLEDLHDLLDQSPPGKEGQGKEIRIREETNGSITIQGLKAEDVTNKAECLNLLNRGISKRVTSATQMNEGSSRSHAIFTIIIDQKIVTLMDPPEGAEEIPEGEPLTQTENISAKFHFVDLAGSERIKKTGAVGKQLSEGININKGLLALGNVISALTDEKRSAAGTGHIPYRDSKLTRILQDSLGGNSRTTMLACVSPAEMNHEESLSTIKYASRARNIKNKPIVNRDANSILIESLRAQIESLTGEVREYQSILKSNDLEIPTDLKEKADQKRQSKAVAPSSGGRPLPVSAAARQQTQEVNFDQQRDRRSSNASSAGMGGLIQSASLQDLRNMKLELARKDKDMKKLEEQLQQERANTAMGQEGTQALQNERDQLVLRQESLEGILEKNKISCEEKPSIAAASSGGKRTQTLIDEYKVKMNKVTSEVEKQKGELMAKSKKIAELQTQIKRDETVLKKTASECIQLKLAAKRAQTNSSASPATQQSARAPVPGKQQGTDTEMIKKSLMGFQDKLESQMEKMFEGIDEEDLTKDESDFDQQAEEAISEVKHAQNSHSQEGNEKILQMVKESRRQMLENLDSLFSKNGNILDLQKQKQKAEKQRDKNARDVQLDEKKSKENDKKFKEMIDDLNKKLGQADSNKKKIEMKIEKEKNQVDVTIKQLEFEVEKAKKQKEQVVIEKKYGEERFSKFKITAKEDIKVKTQVVQDSKKKVSKLQTDLKKADEKAQAKIAELRGLQRKAREEKERRMKEETRDNDKKGIDIDAIKDWITINTDQMIKNKELTEYLTENQEQKNELEDEMLELGDRLTDVILDRDRLEVEQGDLNLCAAEGGDVDEARQLEIEQELESLVMEQEGITDTLDNLGEHMEFLEEKINDMRLEINSYDMENIMPPRFNGLNNVAVAKATLRTFFLVMLDLNVYKKELENKLLDQDEKMLLLTNQLAIFREQDPSAMSFAEQQAKIRKERQMNKIIGQLGDTTDFLDERDDKIKGMTQDEQTQLTKMSLSKIVSNLRNKLKEEEKKNQNLSNKLDQVIKEKEQLKQKQKQLERQVKRGGSSGGSFAPITFSAPPPKDRSMPLPGTQSPSDPAPSTRPTRGPVSRINTGLTEVKASAAAARTTEQEPDAEQKRLSFKERRDMHKKSATVAKPGSDGLKAGQRPARVMFKGPAAQGSSLSEKRNQMKQQKQGMVQTDIAKISGVHSTLPPEIIQEEEDEFEEEEELRRIEEEAAQEKLELELMEEEAEAPIMNWKLETVTGLPMDPDVKLIDLCLLGDRLFVLYDDLTFFEVSVATKEQTQEVQLSQLPDASEIEGQKATAFKVFEELEMFAVTTSSRLVLFDYGAGEPAVVAALEISNIIQICFFDCHVVLCMEEDESDDVTLRCYETQELIEGQDPVGQITVKRFLAQKIIFRTDAYSIFYTAGTQIGRIRVPEMELDYQENSGHSKPIIDFVVAEPVIYTTSEDEGLHVFDFESGMQVIEPLESMECDTLAYSGNKVIMRCGGEALLIFKYEEGGEELEDIGMVELTSAEESPVVSSNFKMQGGALKATLADGKTYDVVLIAQQNEEGLLVKLLTSEAH